MNLTGNTTSPTANQYDAIVIGSGISGGWAAKELTQKGLKTMVLERGRPVEHVKDYPTTMSSPWEMAHRGRYPLEVLEKSPIQAKVAYAFNEYSGQFFIRDTDHPYQQTKPFDWIRGYQVGGKSLSWARWTQRWAPFNFEDNLKDGHGADWPIRYPDLAPWYSYVEKFAGISGNRDGLSTLPDGEFLPPFEMSCIEKSVRDAWKKEYADRHLIISRTANLSKAQPVHLALGRADCQSRNWCGRGCLYGAYFSSNAATLPAAAKTGKLTIRPFSVVHSIIYDERKKKATGVRVIDTNTKEMTEYYARIIFVNAATLNSTLILLNSTSHRFPNGLGNDSGVLGHYLMDHNYRGRVSGVYDGSDLDDKYYYGRRPTGTYVPRFRNVLDDKQTDFVRGYAYACGGQRAGWERGRGKEGFGADFKESLTTPGGWSFSMTAMGEMLPRYENHVRLNQTNKDQWGMPTLDIDCAWSDNEDKMTQDAITQAKAMMEAAGIRVTAAIDNHQNPGLAIHEMGTARMGHDPKTSMLNKWNQLHAVKNVFVTDGASMASSACQNPSLTYMALTARAVDYAVREGKKGDL
ncbi:GMC oxidoreductase [Spirosoma spitsbergense]|uniref:GMC oxidoreductase n=1 Tax=Spirosoma spitsbergense TaxID=431554 RepID=UPI000379A98B|nr:GMC family oxidoreductase [Spirosoma spitsbergense]